MKEKVNTHFSFPMKLNMAPYAEEYLMQNKEQGTFLIMLAFHSKYATNFKQFYSNDCISRRYRYLYI